MCPSHSLGIISKMMHDDIINHCISSSSVFPVVAMSYMLSGSGDEVHGAVQGRFITV